jgi:hypothetical protein
MAKFAHNLEYNVAMYWYAFSKIDGSGEGSYVDMHFPARPNHRREAPSRCDASEEELGIKFTHLILNRYEQCNSSCIHGVA